MCIIQDTLDGINAKREAQIAGVKRFGREVVWLLLALLASLFFGIFARHVWPFLIGSGLFVLRMLVWHNRLWINRK